MNGAFGRYRLLERLGQGGMAEVFKAKSFGVEGFEKVLVIKRILPELARRPDFVSMFIHEAKLAVRLSHANIVQVFDLGMAPGGEVDGAAQADSYYIAMEYVHGLDLSSMLARCRREHLALPLQMGVYIASEIAKGLDHAHRRRDEQMRPLGIVHRDVSPQNVLLSFEGEVKVTDFGIAKARHAIESTADETQSQRLRGKFAYMSPEQARGDAVDASSDLFSLGTILYECLAGINPFAAPTSLETVQRVEACECPPIELLRADMPPELVAIVRTAMARVPTDRYSDAGRMYEHLLAILYAQGSRYGAHDLAQFLGRLRDRVEGTESSMPPRPLLETDSAMAAVEPTPVEGPPSRHPSGAPPPAEVNAIAIERTADMGERRDVTALVLDLPDDAAAPIVDQTVRTIERWGGRVLRRATGQVSALFGLGDPDGRDTEMATRCALVVLRNLESSTATAGGLHTGRVSVSPDGQPVDNDRLDALFDVARKLSRVRDGRVAMSALAMRQVKTLFEFDSPGDADRPGSNVAHVIVNNVRGPAEAFGRFVGRRDELRRVGELMVRVTKRHSQVLTIRGDHGVGKTRLLYEVERRLLRGEYSIGFHIATCPPQGAEFPLLGIVCMLQVLCGTAEGDTQDRILALQPRLRALGLPGDEVNAVLVALGASVVPSDADAKALLKQAFVRVVQSLCDDRPHCFAWDVAHAMDEESYRVLALVLERSAQTRVLLIFAARPGFSHPLETCEGHASLELGDLNSSDVERLVTSRLAVDLVPDELMRFIRARAGGHPLFIEELLKALVDADAISVVDRHVVAMTLVGQDLALPKTLRGLVGSRVARLARADRTTLQAAAVLGDSVDVNALSEMIGQPMPALEQSIAALADRGFIAHVSARDLRFTSPIIPEVVVDALTPDAAREMHTAAGRALEATLGPRAGEQAGRIAAHLYEAGERDRAAAYFAKAAEHHLATSRLEAAANDYTRAIGIAESERPPGELAGWLDGLASAMRLVRTAPDAAHLCGRVIEREDKTGDPRSRVRARVAAGHVLAAVHLMEASRQRLIEAESIAAGDEELSRLVLIAEAELATRQGDNKRALVLLAQLHTMAHATSDAQEQHRIALQLALALAGLGDRATALANLEEATAVLGADRTAQMERARVRALVDYYTRDFQSAATHFNQAVDMGRELGVMHVVLVNLCHLGEVLIRLGDFPRAYGAIRQSLALCEERGDERFANRNAMLLAHLDGLKDDGDSVERIRSGVEYAKMKGFTNDVIRGKLLVAHGLARRHRIADAREEYEATRAMAVEAGQRLVADDCEAALVALTVDTHHEGAPASPEPP
ncbi:MAG: protein kinase [Polyangiaceae bacterium]